MKRLKVLQSSTAASRPANSAYTYSSALQIGVKIMRMDPLAQPDGCGSVTDGEAVFDDILPGGDCRQGDLVASRNRAGERDAQAADLECLPRPEVFQGQGDIVIGMNPHERRRNGWSFSRGFSFDAP